jgi:hypothetical protein
VTVNPLGLRSIGQATGTLQSPFGSGPTELSVSPVAGFGLSGSSPELSSIGAQCESRDGENVRARMHPEGQADAGREAVQFLSTAVASAAQGSLDRGLSSSGPGGA